MVRAVGRQPRLRHRRGGARARRRRRDPVRRGVDAARGALARRRTRTPTAAGARTSARTTTPSWIGRGASTASQTAWALLALLAAGERSDADERGVRWLVRDPAGGRHVGRAVVHRHRLPRRLLHQLPPLPAGVPGDGPRPVRPRGGRDPPEQRGDRRPTAPAHGPARRAAIVLRRRRTSDRHRRARARALRRAGVRAAPDRPQHPRRAGPRGPGRGFVDELDEVPAARPSCSPPTAWRPRSASEAASAGYA